MSNLLSGSLKDQRFSQGAAGDESSMPVPPPSLSPSVPPLPSSVIEPCLDSEIKEFPLRMRDWLKNVLVTLYERDQDNNLLTEKQKLRVRALLLLLNLLHLHPPVRIFFFLSVFLMVFPLSENSSAVNAEQIPLRLTFHLEVTNIESELGPCVCFTAFKKTLCGDVWGNLRKHQ